jgi:TonB family protein
MERRSADARYAAASLALLAMVALPLLTFAHLANEEYGTTLAQAAFVDAGSIIIHAGADAGPTSWSARITFALDRNMPWLMLVWCAGVLVFSCRLAVGMAVAHGWKLQGIQSAPARLQSVFDNLRTRLGVRRAARLVESARVHVPTVIGWLKPVVLLPAGCLVGMSEQQVEALLAHELAHICRNDYLVSVVQSVVEAVLFYHPAVWWVSRQVRREREYCCDEMAVGVCGDRLAYARALSLLEEQRALLPEVVLGANGGVLTMRIKRLLGCREEIASLNLVWVIVLAVVIAGGGSIIGRFAVAESKPAVTTVESMEPVSQDPQASAQTVVAESENNTAEVEKQIYTAEEQLQTARRQFETAQQDLAQATEDTSAPTTDQKKLDEAQKKQLNDAQKQLQAALAKLNSAQFKEQMKAAQEQIEKLNSPEFKKKLEEAAAAAANVNTPEFRKQFEDMQKRLQDSQELQQKIQAKLNSPEFKKQIEDAEKQAEKFNTPEFRKKMEDLQQKLNSPAFKKQLEDAQSQARKFDTPEFREQMQEMQKRIQEEAQKFNSPEYREKLRKMIEDAQRNGAQIKLNSNAFLSQNVEPSPAPEAAASIPVTPPTPVVPVAPVAPVPPAAPAAPVAPNPASTERNHTMASTKANLQVSGSVIAGQAISQTPPVYPQEAKEGHIQGTVVLKATIGKTGNVDHLSVVSGPKELMQSAIDAVSQWKYKPYLLNGQPVEVETTINVNFSLEGGSGAGPGPQASNYTPPEVIYKVEPEYTPETRAAKVAGIVVVKMDVTPQGLPDNVHVVRSLNLALDQKAVEAVSRYRFKPAMREGVPVNVPVNVEVNFQVF